MKVFKVLLVSTSVFAFSSLTIAGEALSLPTEMDSPIENVFIPVGFDDNDNVEIVLKGTYPNSCYRVASSDSYVDHEKREITLTATTYFYDAQRACLEVLTTFLQPIKVGLLHSGNYSVVMKNNQLPMEEVVITEAKTEAPDDFLYANVENASLEVDWDTRKQSLKIQGHHPFYFDGCQVLTEVRAYLSPEDVLVVLPITRIERGQACDDQPNDRSFSRTVPLSGPFTTDGLIHVRTLNGQSINRFVSYFP